MILCVNNAMEFYNRKQGNHGVAGDLHSSPQGITLFLFDIPVPREQESQVEFYISHPIIQRSRSNQTS